MSYAEIKDMVGLTFTKVHDCNDELIFTTEDGPVFRFYHERDCCEFVRIEEIIGDLSDLEGSPLLLAEEAVERPDLEGDSATWTFYKFATVKGYVTVPWLGTSNGYYSEGVSLERL